MLRNFLVIAASISLTATAQANYVLTCHESNAENNVLIGDARFHAESESYDKDGLATLSFPKVGSYFVNDYPDVRMIVSIGHAGLPSIEDLDFRIEDDDTWSTVAIQNVYQVHFGRISMTTRFSAIVTQFEGDLPGSTGPETYDANCELLHL